MTNRELWEGVSYAKFGALARRMGWTADYLAGVLRGKFEVRGETFEAYFDRVLHCRPSGEVVIPFRSVIEHFLVAVEYLARDGKLALCPCGCGSYAGGGGRLAWETCGKRTRSEAQRRSLEKARQLRCGKQTFREYRVPYQPSEG